MLVLITLATVNLIFDVFVLAQFQDNVLCLKSVLKLLAWQHVVMSKPGLDKKKCSLKSAQYTLN